jgi:hypothetical protein
MSDFLKIGIVVAAVYLASRLFETPKVAASTPTQRTIAPSAGGAIVGDPRLPPQPNYGSTDGGSSDARIVRSGGGTDAGGNWGGGIPPFFN